MRVLELRNRVRSLNNKAVVYGILLQAFLSLEAFLVDLNQIQLEEGKNVFDQVIGVYSPATEFISNNPGPGELVPILPKVAGENYNFQWSGGLFDGMKVLSNGREIIWYSTDEKAPLLVQKFGDIFGLTDQHKIEAIKKVCPLFVNAFKNKLLGLR